MSPNESSHSSDIILCGDDQLWVETLHLLYRIFETVLTLEASRRLGETWTLLLEGRAFGGSGPVNPDNLFDPANKGASVARDDYIELELTKFF